MDIKTLCYIHNLLINNENKSALKLKWIREEFNSKADDFEQELISKSEYESIKDQYDSARQEYNQAHDALVEFEAKSWT